MRYNCAQCGIECDKPMAEIADRDRGLNLYCGRVCSGTTQNKWDQG